MKLLNETLKSIEPLNENAVKDAWKYLDGLTKPIASLGELENIAAKMAGITGNVHNNINKKTIIIMCADNGVQDEGVSSCPQELTWIVSNNFTRGITGVNVLADFVNSEITVVDIGIKGEINNTKILDRKIANGTNNMLKGPAMTREEAIKAIETGIEIVDNLVQKGYDLFGTGEMGIGNTTTSSAILSVLSGLDVDTATGRGAALTDEQFENKKLVIKKAIELNKPNRNDIIDVISKVGGFDIAGLCGCYLGAAKNRKPIVIDGFIASAAALCAYRLNPLVKNYIFPSHLSAEPGAKYIMNEIGLDPFLNLGMRLGEGTGCALAFNIIEAALHVINNMGTFDQAGIVTDYLIEMR
ncbi:nicotinate-nucleotide--dimethylbenzimidazole phosphoribosyltransferase [Clostridium tepidiprofundi DSM 19306]|uniref:Nicotinate-nucleotide--dimethylbenzimidazole phosphoribosyltransferase n=1 Tax=Clostridium tepidiprofundi DSM 19306 TaxID=1121338 RepID=A0A151B6G5_9CLOT|nr:nicotinate-nucleotide--dimethylbenzimidazole phosphoribosyltransferase [Clostridium tepidiprofundi]KYH35370.1 nicotinate-nucleotide--dimethylbenzimidazole phosphoribosyltransferase [Clostridium tepidiprofundi DSM 19306]